MLGAEPAVIEARGARAFPARADVRSRTSASATTTARRARRLRRSTSLPGRRSRSSAAPAPGSRRRRRCSPASTTRRGPRAIGGVDVRELALDELRRGVGIVFEETFLFGDTVRATSGSARPDADDEADRARGRGSPARTSSSSELPDGYETVLGERGYLALGRTAPADRDRAGDPRRPEGADPRRRDVGGGRDEGARDPRRAPEVMRGRTTLVIAHRPRRSRSRTASRSSRPAVSSRRERTRSCSHARPLPRRCSRSRGRGVIRRVVADSPSAAAADRRRRARDGRRDGRSRSRRRCSRRYAIDHGIRAHDGTSIERRRARLPRARARAARCSSASSCSAPRAPASASSATCASPRTSKLQRLSLPFFEQQRAGVLISRLTADVQTLTTFTRLVLVEVVGSVLLLVRHARHPRRAVAAALARDARLASRCSSSSSLRYSKRSRPAFLSLRDRVADTMSSLQEGLSGVRVVQSFGREATATRRTAGARARRSARGGASRS